MANPNPYRRLLYCLSILGLLIVCSFGALVAWVVTGTRSINMLSPYIESALAPPGSSYRVNMENALLVWDGWDHPIGIRLENVYMLTGNGAVIAHFPEVGVRLYGLELLAGKVDIKSIELIRPVATLTQDEQGKPVALGFSSDAAGTKAPMNTALMLLTSDTGDNPVTHLKTFNIRHAQLSVLDNHGNPFLSSPDASIEITRRHGIAKGLLTMPLQFDGQHSQIDVNFIMNGNDKTVTSNVAFSQIPLAILHSLAPSQQWMDTIQMPLSGHAKLIADFNSNIDSIDFHIDAGPGSISFPEEFEHPFTPQHITLDGMLSDGLTTYTIRQGLIDFGNHALSFKGTAHKQGDDYGVEGYADTANIPVDEIRTYWPLKLAPHSRRWVTGHLSKGKIVKANVALHFKPGEFKLKDTPEAAIDANISVKGATIAYKPGHPPITDIDGTVKFTGKTMAAIVTHASYMDATHITSAHVDFPDFYPDDVRLFIDMNLSTSAHDILRFLSLPELDKAKKLGLTSQISGEAEGNAKLDFIAFSENDKDDIAATGRMNYAINATLTNAAQPLFMGKHDVSEAFMKLVVNNKEIKTAGKAKIDGLPMDIDLKSIFASNETDYRINADIPIARLAGFGLPKLDFAKGILGINGDFFASDNVEKTDASIDLTRASVDLPQYGFSKKSGEPGTLKLVTEKLPSGNTLIPSFAYKSNTADISGTAEYDKKMNDFTRFFFSPLRMNNTDLDSLAYEKKDNTVRITAKGPAFDVSPYIAKNMEQNNLDFIVDLSTSSLLFGPGREMKNVTVQADCPADACRQVHIHALLQEGTPFTYTIAGGKLFSACDNAGELARVFAIFDTIEGGKMTLTGQYTEGKLQGKLEVKAYTLKNATVLTKLFTVASLSGILDTLTGNGIYFDRLVAPFIYHRGSLIVKDAKTHGAAMGLTADGLINTTTSTFNLTGVLVPSYTLNSLIGNVPLIGNMLMGGSGKGLVALSYTIHGDMKDPSISINPLSVLTPGFLRDIFDIFDKPPPDMDAIMAAQKKAIESGNPSSPATPSAAAPAADPATLPPIDELKR